MRALVEDLRWLSRINLEESNGPQSSAQRRLYLRTKADTYNLVAEWLEEILGKYQEPGMVIQEWEEYLDAQERHDEATIR